MKPSKRVVNDAKKYIDMFLGEHYVAVVLRSVKMAISVNKRHPRDPKKTTATNGINDNGSLQKEIVSHASSLILAGGGSFQNSMMHLIKSQSTQKANVNYSRKLNIMKIELIKMNVILLHASYSSRYY